MADDEEVEAGEEAAPEVLVCAIATPLADAKFTKKVLKVVKKGACSPTRAQGGAWLAAGKPAATHRHRVAPPMLPQAILTCRRPAARSRQGKAREERGERGSEGAAERRQGVRCSPHTRWRLLPAPCIRFPARGGGPGTAPLGCACYFHSHWRPASAPQRPRGTARLYGGPHGWPRCARPDAVRPPLPFP